MDLEKFLEVADNEIRNRFGEKPWHWLVVISVFLIGGAFINKAFNIFNLNLDNPFVMLLMLFVLVPVTGSLVLISQKLAEKVKKRK